MELKIKIPDDTPKHEQGEMFRLGITHLTNKNCEFNEYESIGRGLMARVGYVGIRNPILEVEIKEIDNV